MTLEKWDTEIKPHLGFIEAGSDMAARHARALMLRPEWETIAQDQLAQARQVLESALAKIKLSVAMYAVAQVAA